MILDALFIDKMFANPSFRLAVISLICLIGIQSCVTEDFDNPPAYVGPEIETNATIQDLLAFHKPGDFTIIDEELVVDAIIIADDSSGNYYKTLVLQDDDPNILKGIELKINSTNIFNTMPQGRKIYLKCKGMVISDYNGLVQVGASTYIDENSGDTRLGGIEPAFIDDYIVRGKVDQDITPRAVSIDELQIDKDQSTLVKLTNVQFAAEDTSELFTDQLRTTNRTLLDCEGNDIIVRTSNFADFSAMQIPNGSGSLTGIFSSFGTDKQFFIRNKYDIDLTRGRCDQTIGGDPISIKDLRSLYPIAPEDKVITGVAISDRTHGNIHNLNVVIQDEEGYGILVRFRDSHNINLGDRIQVSTNDADFEEYNGLMQLNNVALSNMANEGPVTVPSPRTITVEEILDDFESLESTLVRIENASITKDGNFDDFQYVTLVDDETDQIEMFTSPGADFAEETIPSSPVTLTAIVSQGGNDESMQLSLRSLEDIEE